jgi:hypothetical protein
MIWNGRNPLSGVWKGKRIWVKKGNDVPEGFLSVEAKANYIKIGCIVDKKSGQAPAKKKDKKGLKDD